MASRHRYTAQQVIDALRANRGLVSLAAQKLQCDVDTVQNYCKRFPTVEAAKQESRVSLLDLAESRLWEAIDRGEAWAVAFCLKTIGRSRGYGERLDVNVSIQAAAQKVAAEFGLTVEAVLQEARLLLLEVDDDAH
jgi:hypothetical protein